MKDILADIDTLRLGNGFFMNHGELYFFSREELKENFDKAFGKLKDFVDENKKV